MKKLCWFTVTVCACLSRFDSCARADATVEGTVQLPKPVSPPKLSVHYLAKIPGEVGEPDPFVAVVYLEGPFPRGVNTNQPAVRVDQKSFQFRPRILPVQAGTLIEFPNLDEGYHNVFSYSKPRRFDLGRYRKDEKPAAIVFDKPGVVKLFCEIHEHMRGTILVLDTPYFIKTDATGKYRLEHLPPGNYKLKAWIDDGRVLEQPVELRDGSVTRVDFPGT